MTCSRYKVAIRQTSTGEVRLYEMNRHLPWCDNSHMWWTTGSHGCDCHREQAFRRAAGEKPLLSEMECGRGRFSALYAEMEDGTRIALDEADH